MTEGALLDEIRSIMSDLFLVDPAELSEDASPESIDAWDSLQHVNLVLDLEARFEIQLDEDDIERMTDLASVVEVVARLRG